MTLSHHTPPHHPSARRARHIAAMERAEYLIRPWLPLDSWPVQVRLLHDALDAARGRLGEQRLAQIAEHVCEYSGRPIRDVPDHVRLLRGILDPIIEGSDAWTD